MKRSLWIVVLIVVVLACLAAALSFFQATGVNRVNPDVDARVSALEQ
ncbi:MAG TPA: hypothetical protein VGN60_02450 [Devosia sp.]|jgi:flagellar basal body-associated protein FliL|nr:hypothetical protein [Devosia sp.]